jgi:uncharacterized protein with FMN-binding domain
MKRALFIGGGTLAGIAAVLSYVPTNFGNSALAPLPAPSLGSTPTSTPSKTSTPPATSASNKTVTGGSYSACGYGNIQVRITVAKGVVTKIDPISSPNGDPRSQFINKQAIPWLQQETLAAKNSAKIAGVGGATCTSGAWSNSLQSALTAAGI